MLITFLCCSLQAARNILEGFVKQEHKLFQKQYDHVVMYSLQLDKVVVAVALVKSRKCENFKVQSIIVIVSNTTRIAGVSLVDIDCVC